MSRRVRRLLFATAVIGLLAVGASGSAARVTGNGTGDHTPPNSYWGNKFYGSDSHGRYWNGWGDGNGDLNGKAFDNSNDALHPGSVANVQVSVSRQSGSHCQHMNGYGRLGHATSCNSLRWQKAKGTSDWNYRVWRRLPKGQYRIHRRAVDAAGNKERAHMMRLRIR
jgi:hypothetical protein